MLRHLAVPFFAACVLACGGSTGPDATPVATTAVDVRDNFFSPVAVTAGTQSSITWTWRGGTGHNVTFEDGQGSSITQVTGSHARTFSSAGTFRYRCTIHSTNFSSGMVGSVTIN